MNTSNEVYFSSLLKTDYPKVYRAIVDVLDRHSIKHGLLESTRDYWCRDYMPVQSGFHDYIQFVYHPDYLKKERQYETDSTTVFDNAQALTGIAPTSSHLIADGGNFTFCRSREGKPVIVMTEKIFAENPSCSREEVISELRVLFHQTDILFLPWDRLDKGGPTDGILHYIGDGKVLTNLNVYSKQITNQMRERLRSKFEIVDLKISDFHKYSWAYINMLEIGDVIIVSGLGLPTDQEALNQIQDLFPNHDVCQVNIFEIVKKWGGAINCLSWTIRR